MLQEIQESVKMKNDRNFMRRPSTLLVGIGLAVLITLGGCKNFLNQAPLGQQTSETFFKTQQDAIDATNATYSMLRDWQVHVFSWIGLTSIVSDNADKGSTPGDASFLENLNDLQFDPGNVAFSDPWAGYYKGIYRANLAIQNIPNIKMDATMKNRLIAENKFLRAYFYFFLVRAYGNVPLITKPLNADQYNQPNSTPDSVYALIERDLQFAVQNLPVKSQYSSADQGRASKGAAQGLLAKVYLYRQDYKDAQKYAEDVINSGEYSLDPNYAQMFTLGGENNTGTIFSAECVATASGNGGSQYGQVQGVRGNPNLGWGFDNPSMDLINSYDEGDPRQEATVLFVWEQTPDGAVVHKNPNMVDEHYNQKVYVPESALIGGQGDNPANIRILRYADVLLIASEAAYQNGDVSTAQKYLNMVRDRARDGRTATVGLSVESLAPTVADTLGMSNLANKPFVRYVWKNSAASQAGIAPFSSSLVNITQNGQSTQGLMVDTVDVIQSVNGTAVNNATGYYNEISSIGANQPVTLDITRIIQTYNSSNQTISTTSQPVIAQMTTTQLLPDITATGTTLLHDIWHERREELAMEQHRWFDLIRENKVESGWAAQEMAKDGKTFKASDELYPIPQNDIDLSNGVLKQNPGY